MSARRLPRPAAAATTPELLAAFGCPQPPLIPLADFLADAPPDSPLAYAYESFRETGLL